jgi:ankyrin repeat protein
MPSASIAHMMACLRSAARILLLASATTALAVVPAAAITQQQLDEVLQAVVMIRGLLADDTTSGAGIIVGRDRDSIYVVTARHVVARGDLSASKVEVQFKTKVGTWVPAAILERSDAQMDLAVLRVQTTTIDPCAVHLERAADVAALVRASEVFPIGYPNGVAWGVPATPGRIGRADANEIVFESEFLAAGASGGALVTDTGAIAAIVKSDAGPFGQALPLSAALARVREWGYPVMLRVPSTGTAGPLHAAADKGDIAALERELFSCSNLDARDPNGETPLHRAAANGHTAVARRLIERGAAADIVSDVKRTVVGVAAAGTFLEQEQKTPLHLAIEARAADIALLLIDKGADPQRKAIEIRMGPSRRSYTPITWTPTLTLAVRQHLTAVIEALIAKGADLDAPVDTRWRDETEIEHNASLTPLRTAIGEGYPEAVVALLRGGARTGRGLLEAAVEDGSQCTVSPESAVAVMQGLLRGNADVSDRSLNAALDRGIRLANGADRERACPKPRLVELVIERGAGVNRDGDEPPLAMAARYDAVSAAASLIAHGASVNARNRFGESALYQAARYGAADVAALLVKSGADVNVRDAIEDSRQTPLLRLVASSESDRLQAFVETARTLIAGKANLNVRDADGDTALNNAVVRDKLPLVRVLLDAGANPGIADDNGWTPLHHAAQGGKLEIARALLDRGAMLDPRNSKGETPLWRAVMVVSGNGGPAKEREIYEVAQLLVMRGANVNIPTHETYTMLDDAVANRDFETARYLLSHGATGSPFTMEKLAAGR